MTGDASIDFDCGIAIKRITAWLDDELGLAHTGGAQCEAFDVPSPGTTWDYPRGQASCHVRLEPLESRPLGMVHLERTRLTAWGDAGALEEFRKAFTLRFMSAGG